MKAIECQKEQCAIILLDHDADPNLVDAKHNTALHYAALIPNVSLAGHLLEHRAHIDVQNQEGYTPLLLAVIQNHQEMVEFLLKKGADVNARDNFKRTALILAAKGEQTGMIKLLLEHNADTYLEDDQGWTAENHATFSGFHAHSLLIAQYALQKNPKQCSSSIFNSPDRAFVSGFTLGGPATDKKGMDESSSESLSRASNKPSPSDSWPPSDEEESDFSTKKPAKPNLSRLINASQQIKKDDDKPTKIVIAHLSCKDRNEAVRRNRGLSNVDYKALDPSTLGPNDQEEEELGRNQDGQLEEFGEEEEEEEFSQEEQDDLKSGGDPDYDEIETAEESQIEDEYWEPLKGKKDVVKQEQNLSTFTSKCDGHEKKLEICEENTDLLYPTDIPVSFISGNYEYINENIVSTFPLEKESVSYSLKNDDGDKPPCQDEVQEINEKDHISNTDHEEECGNTTQFIPKHNVYIKGQKSGIVETEKQRNINQKLNLKSPKPLNDRSIENNESKKHVKWFNIICASLESHDDTPLDDSQMLEATYAQKVQEESVETEDEEENSGNSSDDAPKEQPHSFKSLTKSLNSSTGYLKTQNTSQNCALGGDILPELGVEEEEESWKSESASESTPERSVPHLPAARSNEPTNSISKEKSEDIFYEPSFVSGSRNCNMNKLEDVRNLGRPVDHMDNYENHPVSKSNTTKAVVSKDSVNQEEEQMVKQNRTSDFMEEFGLDNADDIEDASDWDSTDTSYKNSQNVPQYSPEVKRAQKDSNGDLEDATISSSSRHSEKSPVPKNSSEEAHEGLSGSIPQQVEEEKIKHKYDEMGTLEKRHESDKSVQEKMAKIPRQHSQINNTVSSKERSPLILSHWKSHDGHFAGGEGSKETPDQQKSAEKGIHKKSKEPAQMAVDGDLDDLTQSSDTATEEFDFPSLNTKNPMLLIEQLGVHCNDSAGLLQVQNAFLSCERSVEFEKGRYQLLLSKVELMKKEKKELQEELSETREIKSKLEHEKVEWESELSSLRFTLKQEEEKKLSMEIKYEKAREQLKRKEDQYCKELEMKQQLELTLRTLDLELRTVRNNLKQVEEERNDTQRQLSQEQSARALQDDILNNHIWRQKEIEAAQKTATHSSEIPDNHEKEKELQHINQKLQEEIAILKLEVDTARVQNQEKESRYVDENEALKEKNEDLQKELKLNEEALTKRMFQYNGQLTVLTAENAMLRSQMENEKQNKDRLETEMESYRSRLSTAIQEHEKSQVAKSDAERKFQRERDEWLRLQDKLNHDLSNLRDTNGVLSQHLSQAESKANGLENELHRLRDIIREKSLSLESAQRDLQQTQCQAKELERVCQNEKAQMTKFTVKQESMTERLAQLQSENALLRQQLEDAQNKGIVQDKVVNDVQVLFRDIVDKLHAESDKQILLVEERNKELTCKCSHLREQLYKSETQQADREATIRQLQQELADSLKKQSMSEASLEVTTRYRNDLEDEKQQLQKELDKIRNKMQESEELQMQYKRCNHELEDHVQKLEIENTTLEATIKQQTTRIELLQKEPQDSSSSENEKENLKKLNQIKRSLENRLEHEIKKNQELQKNIDGFQKDIKTMKKKQKEYEKRELNFQGESKYSHSKIDDQVNKLKIKIDGLSQKLEGATSKYSLLETTNQDLKEQLFSLQKNYEISEKIKRQLEEEMVNLKRYQEMNMFERSQMEQYKREVDEQAKQEIVKKLEEVNLFLQTQAASQETLEKLRENNNASLINQMETRIKDLEMELARLKNSSQNNTFQKDPTQAELERYRGLYNEESNIRKSLSSKLDRANERLAETNVKLLSERQKRRSLISSLTSSPVLEPTHLGNLSYSFVFNRGLDLGGSFLGATPSTPSSETTVETYLTKMRQELDRKITKELAEANTELQFATLRVSPQGSTDDSSRNPNCHRDPAARATQEYLDILKKNYMI
ncbi:ankyrin repeat domain-containing protein 26 isoform X4 [Ornithorhynchus anatinus]|uniref:ankyrin repeat domain-containing protein 26 isoform X4 n=1 Tax=Ornithorhynchus anatinus TaxID=9258 RepID=UPI0010A7B3AF|nr:ankyrin repeat domain-containing protein 26 isoform X4 [Ornithorhynchus anatinus]